MKDDEIYVKECMFDERIKEVGIFIDEAEKDAKRIEPEYLEAKDQYTEMMD